MYNYRRQNRLQQGDTAVSAMNTTNSMSKGKFLLKYTLLYAACLFCSLGIGFVLASVSVDGGLWQYAVPAACMILAVALIAAFILSNVMYRRMEKEIAARRKNPYKK